MKFVWSRLAATALALLMVAAMSVTALAGDDAAAAPMSGDDPGSLFIK